LKLKINKIRYFVWLLLVIFSCFILVLLYILQIVSLDKYYEIYKTRQLNAVISEIKSIENVSNEELADLSFENGICVSVFSGGENEIISNIFNKGCILGDQKISDDFVNDFIESGQEEQTMYINNPRFRNKTIVKGLKYKDDKYIFLNSSLAPLEPTIVLLESQYGLIAVTLLIISIFIGLIIAKSMSKPIVELSNKAKLLAKGNFNVKFTGESNIEEIKDLANTLELAKNELSRTDELRRDLMANVGHDLRTPLTMIKAYAEMTRDLKNQTPKKKKENLDIIIEETDRLSLLVNDIIELSKLQSNTYELKCESFNLNDLIKNILKRYKIIIVNEEYIIEYNNFNSEDIIINADKKKIEQVIYNLVNNAINYTGDDKKVIINLIDEGTKVKIEIKDSGKGIKSSEINYIWDKYYHNKKKHKRNAYGTGLGLSIVKNILEMHNYNYGVVSERRKGSTFYFEIDKK